MRGLASIVVVLTHAVAAFYPHAVFGEPYAARSSHEMWLQMPPFSLALAGHFAVCLFFILSGYVLSVKFVGATKSSGELIQAALKRPVRLGGLVVFTVLLGYGLMCAQWLNPMAASNTARLDWLETFWKTPPSPWQFMCDVVWQPFAAGSHYNPPLWTIHKELVGSYLVFVYCGLSMRLARSWRWALLSLLAALAFRTLYVGFIIGIAFAEARHVLDTSPQPAGHRRTAFRSALAFALLFAGLALGSQLHYQSASPLEVGSRVETSAWLSALGDFGTGACAMFGGGLTFAAVWLSPRLQRAIDTRVLRYVGHISYALYALHFLVLGSLTTWLHQQLVDSLGWHLSAAASLLLSMSLLVPLAHLATAWIDRPSIHASAFVARHIYRLASCVYKLATRGRREAIVAGESLTLETR